MNIEDLIIQAKNNNNKIDIDIITEINLSEKEYEELLNFLKEKNIEIVSNESKKDYEKTDLFFVSADDPLKIYNEEISRYPRLTLEEEKQLFHEYNKGSEQARKKIIESNLKLVVWQAGKIFNRRKIYMSSILDLVQDGNEGLMKAVEKFDVSKGYRFSTYATWWIRQAIDRGLINNNNPIRRPVHYEEALKKLKKFIIEYYKMNECEPSKKEIADNLGVTIEFIDNLKKYDCEYVSFDVPVKEDTDSTLKDLVRDEKVLLEEECCERIYNADIIDVLKTMLPSRDFEIIKLRYGFDDDVPKTLQEVGDAFGITRERVRQIEMRSLRRAKRVLSNQKYNTEVKVR